MARLKPDEREKQILDGAIRFFSEHGFAGQTRELAAQLGVAQALLYRYFPSKSDLIARAHAELFEKRWDDGWELMLKDTRRPIRARFTEFYQRFSERIYSREWVRMLVYAGLDGEDYHFKVLDSLTRRIFRRMCVELRSHCGYARVTPGAIKPEEIEYVWEIHGIIFYYFLRKYVYRVEPLTFLEDVIDNMMDILFAGAPRVLDRLLGPPAMAA